MWSYRMSGQSRKARSVLLKGTASAVPYNALRRGASALPKAGVEAQPERLNRLLQYREKSKQDEQKFFSPKTSTNSHVKPQNNPSLMESITSM
jgi:hypothetical protein